MPIAHRPALALLPLLVALALPAAAQQFQITPVWLPDTPLPLPGSGWQVYIYHENTAGQLSIGVTRPGPNSYEWASLRISGTTLEVAAKSGDAAPGLLGGTFDDVSSLGITSSGDVILLGSGCVEISEELSECSQGIYRWAAGELAAIALTGQSIPGTGGRTLAMQPGNSAVGPAGHVVFSWVLDPDSIRGFFVASDGEVAPFALQGDPAPGTPHSFVTFFLHEPKVNSAGDIAFEAGIQWSPIETGLFLRSESGLRGVMLPGMAAPGSGTFSGSGQLFALNELGSVAFDAILIGGAEGIFVDSGGSLRTVARTGQPIPGTPHAFEHMYGPTIDEGGAVAFYAYGQGLDYPRGIYAEAGGQIIPVVLDGAPAPVGVSGTLEMVSHPTLGAGGDLLFSASFGSPQQQGIFRARRARQVPALGAPATALLAAALLASAACLGVRRDAERAAGR